jgi:hypothetical protein
MRVARGVVVALLLVSSFAAPGVARPAAAQESDPRTDYDV